MATATTKHLLDRIARSGSSTGLNVVAFSGGVDSSVVAAAVARVYPSTSLACIGRSAALPEAQLQLARKVASTIGIPLHVATTAEGEIPGYLENRGMSCYHCKSELYATLSAVVDAAHEHRAEWSDGRGVEASLEGLEGSAVLFNGTNADDTTDLTRVGLVAAREWRVESPIDHLTKAEVREVARAFDLPNADVAASPCLRSRLAFGVEATSDHLERVESAELRVRDILRRAGVPLKPSDDLRVRALPRGRAAVEIGANAEPMQRGLAAAQSAAWFAGEEGIRAQLAEVGFASVELRGFASGSVAATVPAAT